MFWTLFRGIVFRKDTFYCTYLKQYIHFAVSKNNCFEKFKMSYILAFGLFLICKTINHVFYSCVLVLLIMFTERTYVDSCHYTKLSCAIYTCFDLIEIKSNIYTLKIIECIVVKWVLPFRDLSC